MDPMALASSGGMGFTDSPIGGDTSASGDIYEWGGSQSNGGFTFAPNADTSDNSLLYVAAGLAVAYFIFKGRK